MVSHTHDGVGLGGDISTLDILILGDISGVYLDIWCGISSGCV